MRGGIGKLVGGLAAAMVIGLGAAWAAGSIMTRGHQAYVAAATAPATDIALNAPDGVTIAGTFIPGRSNRSPAVFLLHGVGASRQATAENATWLAQLGYATLAIDFRGHGRSSISPRTFGLTEALDARAAFTWLKRRQNDAPVAIIGISLGGAASLIGEAGPIPADALILQAVYPDIRRAIGNRIASRRTSAGVGALLEPLLSFQAPLRFGVWPSRLSPLRAIPQFHRPVFVIGGQQDRSTPPAETHELFAAAHQPKLMWLAPAADHAATCNLAGTAYRHRVKAFLARTIGDPLAAGSGKLA